MLSAPWSPISAPVATSSGLTASEKPLAASERPSRPGRSRLPGISIGTPSRSHTRIAATAPPPISARACRGPPPSAAAIDRITSPAAVPDGNGSLASTTSGSRSGTASRTPNTPSASPITAITQPEYECPIIDIAATGPISPAVAAIAPAPPEQVALTLYSCADIGRPIAVNSATESTEAGISPDSVNGGLEPDVDPRRGEQRAEHAARQQRPDVSSATSPSSVAQGSARPFIRPARGADGPSDGRSMTVLTTSRLIHVPAAGGQASHCASR